MSSRSLPFKVAPSRAAGGACIGFNPTRQIAWLRQRLTLISVLLYRMATKARHAHCHTPRTPCCLLTPASLLFSAINQKNRSFPAPLAQWIESQILHKVTQATFFEAWKPYLRLSSSPLTTPPPIFPLATFLVHLYTKSSEPKSGFKDHGLILAGHLSQVSP